MIITGLFKGSIKKKLELRPFKISFWISMIFRVSSFLVIDKIIDWTNLVILVSKPVTLNFRRCSTYCSTSHRRERKRSRDNEHMKTLPSSHATDSFTAPSCHRHSFPCSSSAPWNNYFHFSRFWDKLYGPFRLGLGTEVRLWSHLHFLFNWRISNLVGH